MRLENQSRWKVRPIPEKDLLQPWMPRLIAQAGRPWRKLKLYGDFDLKGRKLPFLHFAWRQQAVSGCRFNVSAPTNNYCLIIWEPYQELTKIISAAPAATSKRNSREKGSVSIKIMPSTILSVRFISGVSFIVHAALPVDWWPDLHQINLLPWTSRADPGLLPLSPEMELFFKETADPCRSISSAMPNRRPFSKSVICGIALKIFSR